MGARHPKNTEFRSTQKLGHQFTASLAELSRVSRNRSRVLIYGIYHRIYRIYLIIYLFGSKLLLIFTNPKNDATTTDEGDERRNMR